MSPSDYDMAIEFEGALAEWNAALMRAHLDLAATVTALQDRYAAELAQPSGESSADALAEIRAGIDTLNQVVGDGSAPPDAASDCIMRLEGAVGRLQVELGRLRAQAAQGARVSGAGPVRPLAAEGQLLEASELAARLGADSDLAGQLAQAVQERDAARQELTRLRTELDALQDSYERQGKAATEAVAFEAFDASGEKRRMGEILVAAGVLTEEQLGQALEEQKKDRQRRLGSIIVELGFASEGVIAQALATQLGLPFVRLETEPIDISATRLISSQLATLHMMIPVRTTPGRVVVAMANPLDLVALDDVARATNLHVDPVVAALSDVSEAIVRYYSVT